MSRAGILGVSLTLVLAAGGTAAYSLAGRRSPAAAAHRPVPVADAPVRLRAHVSAERVTYGATVRIVGMIRDAAGRPLAGRTVEVVTAPLVDRSAVRVLGTPLSDATGRVRASVRPREGSAVWLRFAGGGGLAEGVSAAVPVAVRPRLTITESTVRTRDGFTTTLRGAVAPAGALGRVRLDRHGGSGWRTVRAGRVSAASRYDFTVRHTRPGTYRYRVVRLADEAYLAAAAERHVRLVPKRAPRVGAGPGGPGKLLVAGDSFAFFLGQQLAAARKPRTTDVESRHSSGLARPDFFDWERTARKQAATRPGGVVVFLGANDCQPIRVGGTQRWVTVGSEAWVAEYSRRAADLMRAYSGGGDRPVYWVGLPIVQKPDIAACYRAINTATRTAARRVDGVTWVDSWGVYAVNGRYSEYVAGVLARQDDGIHLTFEGTRFLTRKVYALLSA